MSPSGSDPTSQRLGECDLLELLGPNTYLARDHGRRVVLKQLPEDCLLGRRLHPMVQDRLRGVRELAVLHLANLLGVQHDGPRLYLVWEYLPGLTLQDWLSQGPHSLASIKAVARQLVDVIESIHALGMVHGAVHARNVIIGEGDQVRLTHVSPLLFDDPENDRQALVRLLGQMLASPTDALEPVLHLTPQVQAMDLRQLAGWLDDLGMAADSHGSQAEPGSHERRFRRRALVAAALALAMGAAIAWGAWRWARAQRSFETAPRAAPAGAGGLSAAAVYGPGKV